MTSNGIEETVTLADRSAATSCVDEFDLPAGVTAKARDGGGVSFLDATGEEVATFAPGLAFDNRLLDQPLPGVGTDDGGYHVVRRQLGFNMYGVAGPGTVVTEAHLSIWNWASAAVCAPGAWCCRA